MIMLQYHYTDPTEGGPRARPSRSERLEPVRLVNGTSAYEGRLEIYHEDRWGTVCDDRFTDVDAQKVVCTQLFQSLWFPHVSKSLWLDTTNLLGTGISMCNITEVIIHSSLHDTKRY